MTDELLNAAILLRRGSWVDPELFERAAKRIEELESERSRLISSANRFLGFVSTVRKTNTTGWMEAMCEFATTMAGELGEHSQLTWDAKADWTSWQSDIDAAIAESAKKGAE